MRLSSRVWPIQVSSLLRHEGHKNLDPGQEWNGMSNILIDAFDFCTGSVSYTLMEQNIFNFQRFPQAFFSDTFLSCFHTFDLSLTVVWVKYFLRYQVHTSVFLFLLIIWFNSIISRTKWDFFKEKMSQNMSNMDHEDEWNSTTTRQQTYQNWIRIS